MGPAPLGFVVQVSSGSFSRKPNSGVGLCDYEQTTASTKSEIQGFFPFGFAQGQNDDLAVVSKISSMIIFLAQ
jgi:hypothetical protein